MMPTLNKLRFKQVMTVMLLPVFLLTIACSDDDSPEETNADVIIEQIYNAMSTGSWSITLYNDSGVDETGDYDNYTFTFASDGKLIADNGMETFTGLWYITKDDDGSDDSTDDENDIDFNIAFSSNDLLLEISDDWDVSSWSGSSLELIDVSGGDGSTDLLTFEKN